MKISQVKGLSAQKLRYLDQKAQNLGIDEIVLIENAASNLFSIINGLNLGKKVLVIAGRGNNGADVLSCARKLLSRGYITKVVIVEDKPLGWQAQLQKDILEKINTPIYNLKANQNLNGFKKLLKESDFIIDGILGIGIKGEISIFLKKVILLINQSNKKVIACDIPSGLSPDDGKILGEAIKADYTVSFLAPKKGFFLNQGPHLCGKIFVVDIGISKEILEKKEKYL